jgi:trk system potassium uptake protein TrkH
VSSDYSLWGTFAFGAFFLMAFMGGCAGSSAGGIKMFRFRILFSMVHAQMRRLLQPNGVFRARYNGRPVPASTVGSVMSFLFLFVVSFLMFTIGLLAMGLDLVTAATGASSALANVGPGLGDIIGPAGNYQPLPDSAKWLLSFAMMMGRLELMTVLILFTPSFWRA